LEWKGEKVMNDLTKYMPLDAIVQNYEEAKKELETGYRNLWKANARISSVAGGYAFSDYKVMDSRVIERDMAAMKKKVWRFVINKVEIYNLISDKRRKELDDQLEKGELPEISVENVQSTLDNLLDNIGNLYKETVMESFEWLRPHGSRHKTNTEYEVGKKAIKEWMFDCSYGCRLSYTREQDLKGLDNAFHLMDGKGPVKWPGDMVTKITEAVRDKKWEAETEYFKLKWYKVGTLHIEFKRLDLVAKMNAMAGGNRLRKAA
jgi:hypothetical protein